MKNFFILIILSISTVSLAGTNITNGYWLGTFTKNEIRKDVSLWAETQLRYNLSVGEMGQLLYRFGPLIKLDKLKFELGLLYGFIQNNNSKEHRLTLQHAKNYDFFKDWPFSTRIRLEHRIRENIEESSQRIRILARISKDISNSEKIVLWNEIFINLKDNTWAGKKSDRNRLFLGIRNVYKTYNIEYGYLNQYAANSDIKSMSHVLVTYFNF